MRAGTCSNKYSVQTVTGWSCNHIVGFVGSLGSLGSLLPPSHLFFPERQTTNMKMKIKITEVTLKK